MSDEKNDLFLRLVAKRKDLKEEDALGKASIKTYVDFDEIQKSLIRPTIYEHLPINKQILCIRFLCVCMYVRPLSSSFQSSLRLSQIKS